MYNRNENVMKKGSLDLIVFHDEREIPKKWLYHGYVLCRPENLCTLQDHLASMKSEASCRPDKRIHFSDITSHSTGSSRTRTAVSWAELFVKHLYQCIWFYLLGIDLTKIDYGLYRLSASARDKNFSIYNRFFEVGLFSACRYFFDYLTDRIEILDIFSEERTLESSDPFLTYAPYKINQREDNIEVKCQQITQVSGDPLREHVHPECVNTLNFVDVILGAFSQSMDWTSSQSGCKEIAQKVYPVCWRLSERPYNKNSKYYKRYAMSFFPKVLHSKSRIMWYGIRPPEQQFYASRNLRLFQSKCLPGFE
jgi:hypothetical protein